MLITIERIRNIFSPKKVEAPVLAPAVDLQTKLFIPTHTAIIKPLKWVVHKDELGIVASMDFQGGAELHMVNSSGVTVEVRQVSISSLRLARYLEIPENRRPESAAYAAVMGYI